MTVCAVVVCAGMANRMGGIDKIFTNICGVPVIARTLLACMKSECITSITVVTKPENFEKVIKLCKQYGITKPVAVIGGGDSRAQSVEYGVSAADSEFVAIMDGARPLVKPSFIDETCRAAFEYGAAALGVKMTDTVKRIDNQNNIVETVDRTSLVRIQTPQVFNRREYISLLNKSRAFVYDLTDDCALFEHFGKPIKVVYGSDDNIKLTVKDDLNICERLVDDMAVTRVGHGYDVHKLVAGRELWLCGEKIDFELGLDGHSDADVALHALTDALLGAAAMGDIGKLFPDNDPAYKGISSILLLQNAAKKVFEKYSLVNCDVTIIAQKPKLLPHIENMRKNIAVALGVGLDCVSVKATTEEHLGFTGRLEGISAHAVCTIK